MSAGTLKTQPVYTTNSGVSLQNVPKKSFLTWGKQPIGINLVYQSKETDHKVHFVTPDKAVRDVLTGEPVAFGIGGGESFLYYKNRTLGINLGWSQEPDFEWRIYGASGKKGEKIEAGKTYAIMNTQVKPNADFMVFFDRPPGMCDVGWTSSPTTLGDLISVGKAVAAIAPMLV